MSNSGDLLRLLMPAVSPVPTRDTQRPGALPIESQSFESLLDEARQSQALTDATTQATNPEQTTGPEETAPKTTHNALSSLTGVESIQNASLRRIVAQARG
ncbi:MAG: hypothetical protein R3C45_16085 [Phycisphaerales bacterium]